MTGGQERRPTTQQGDGGAIAVVHQTALSDWAAVIQRLLARAHPTRRPRGLTTIPPPADAAPAKASMTKRHKQSPANWRRGYTW